MKFIPNENTDIRHVLKNETSEVKETEYYTVWTGFDVHLVCMHTDGKTLYIDISSCPPA